MSIEEVIALRGIREVMHFTTNRGLLGILAAKAIKPRKRLPGDAQLEYLFLPNTEYRKDIAWVDYVNLSVSRVNNRFLRWSRRQPRNEKLFWCILALSPKILLHPGVQFVTTNNIYTGVKRGTLAEDLEALFAPRVHQWGAYYVDRGTRVPDCCPTCEQAEILYPGELPAQYIDRIYVPDHETQDEVHAMIGAVACQDYDVRVDASKFAG
jgi:hypothetical protein